MGARLGHDFSRVRVHADAGAAESARAVSALAYTVGPHVVFGAGRYAPETPAGRRLLAHELAHVANEGEGTLPSAGSLRIGSASDPEEAAADGMASRAIAGEPSSATRVRSTAKTTFLRRQEAAAAPAATCSPEAMTGLQLFTTSARKLVDDAIAMVEARRNAADKGTTDAASSNTDEALTAHFRIDAKYLGIVLPEVLRVLRRGQGFLVEVEGVNAASPPDWIVCASDGGACRSAVAYVQSGEGHPILTVCPSISATGQNKGASEDVRVETMIHEAMHAGEAGVRDYSYESERAFVLQSTGESLRNADSYLALVMQLAKGVRPSHAPKDSVEGTTGEGGAIAREALALAELWNRAAFDAMQDANGREDVFARAKKASVGTVPSTYEPQKRAGVLKEAFIAAKSLFASSLSVKADSSGNVCDTNQWAIYEGGVIHVCASALAKRTHVGNLYPTGYSVARAILFQFYSSTLNYPDLSFAVVMGKEARAVITAAPQDPRVVREQTVPAATRRKSVKKGDHGCPVPELQEKLVVLKYLPGPVDGVFAASTETAVSAFQASKQLGDAAGVTAGQVEAKTWSELFKAAPGQHGLPTGERAIPGQWLSGDNGAIFEWQQELLPKSVDFSGCWVGEVALPDTPQLRNTCCREQDVCPTGLTGGAWEVEQGNRFGPDAVGIVSALAARFHDSRALPCGYSAPQAMVMFRDEAMVKSSSVDRRKELGGDLGVEQTEYVRNVLSHYIRPADLVSFKSNAFGTVTSPLKPFPESAPPKADKGTEAPAEAAPEEGTA